MDYPGRPVGGEDFAGYLTGFEPRPDYIESDYEPEDIEISYLGRQFYTTHADAQGGLLVEVPVPELWPAGQVIEIVATGTRSGIVRRLRLDAVPYVPALWATSGSVTVAGAGAIVTGLVHAEAAVVMKGAGGGFTGGVEHVGDLVVNGSGITINPKARAVAPRSRVRTVGVDAFAPGGSEARAAGSAYRAIPSSACVNGVWQGDATTLRGVVFVPCAVVIRGSGVDVSVTLAAKGDVTVSGSGVRLRAVSRTGASIVSSGAVTVSGSRLNISGTVFATGRVTLSGSGAHVACGIVASEITVSGAGFAAEAGQACLPQ